MVPPQEPEGIIERPIHSRRRVPRFQFSAASLIWATTCLALGLALVREHWSSVAWLTQLAADRGVTQEDLAKELFLYRAALTPNGSMLLEVAGPAPFGLTLYTGEEQVLRCPPPTWVDLNVSPFQRLVLMQSVEAPRPRLPGEQTDPETEVRVLDQYFIGDTFGETWRSQTAAEKEALVSTPPLPGFRATGYFERGKAHALFNGNSPYRILID